jgi:hypothetical protein
VPPTLLGQYHTVTLIFPAPLGVALFLTRRRGGTERKEQIQRVATLPGNSYQSRGNAAAVGWAKRSVPIFQRLARDLVGKGMQPTTLTVAGDRVKTQQSPALAPGPNLGGARLSHLAMHRNEIAAAGARANLSRFSTSYTICLPCQYYILPSLPS